MHLAGSLCPISGWASRSQCKAPANRKRRVTVAAVRMVSRSTWHRGWGMKQVLLGFLGRTNGESSRKHCKGANVGLTLKTGPGPWRRRSRIRGELGIGGRFWNSFFQQRIFVTNNCNFELFGLFSPKELPPVLHKKVLYWEVFLCQSSQPPPDKPRAVTNLPLALPPDSASNLAWLRAMNQMPPPSLPGPLPKYAFCLLFTPQQSSLNPDCHGGWRFAVDCGGTRSSLCL